MLSGPVAVAATVHLDGITVTVTPITRIRPVGLRGDLDNFFKAVADALTDAGIYADDRQIEQLTVRFENRPGGPPK